MKYSLLIGIICLAVAIVFFYLDTPEVTSELFIGSVGGLGIGFMLGGFLGYFTKKTKKVVEEKVVEVVVEKEVETPSNSENPTLDGDIA